LLPASDRITMQNHRLIGNAIQAGGDPCRKKICILQLGLAARPKGKQVTDAISQRPGMSCIKPT
jgi:hypothetical protein